MYKVRVDQRPDFGQYNLQRNRSMEMMARPVDKDYLPVINNLNRYKDIEKENQNNMQNQLNFLHDRSLRAIRQNNPFDNVPLYNPDIPNFLQNYPQNLPNYRPIRYFFQQPLNIQPKFAYQHNMGIPMEKGKDGVIKDINKVSNKQYAKPLKVDDMVKKSNELKHPKASIESKEVSKKEAEKKQKENNEVLIKAHQLRYKRLKEKTKEYWKTLRKLVIIMNFYHIYKRFIKNKKIHTNQSEVLDKTVRYHALELLNFTVAAMKGQIEQNIKIYLTERLKYTGAKDKIEDSFFRTKTFIHNLLNIVVSAFAKPDEIPGKIKKIVLDIISEKVPATCDFYTTFEFNRIEFDLKLRLKNMTIDRKAMLVGFIFLYRIFVTEIMSDILKYFPDIVSEARKEKEDFIKISKAQLDKNYFAKIGLSENKKLSEVVNNAENYGDEVAKVEEIIKYNTEIITQIIAFLIQNTFSQEPKIYREYYKEKHLYFDIVQDSEEREIFKKSRGTGRTTQGVYYESLIKDDMIEFYSVDNEESLLFIKENYKWVQLTKHTIFGFCISLVDNVS